MPFLDSDQARPYLRTPTGGCLHYGPCESTYDRYTPDQITAGAVAMTRQQAADWLAADPRRALCRRCHPPMPHGRLRVVR